MEEASSPKAPKKAGTAPPIWNPFEERVRRVFKDNECINRTALTPVHRFEPPPAFPSPDFTKSLHEKLENLTYWLEIRRSFYGIESADAYPPGHTPEELKPPKITWEEAQAEAQAWIEANDYDTTPESTPGSKSEHETGSSHPDTDSTSAPTPPLSPPQKDSMTTEDSRTRKRRLSDYQPDDKHAEIAVMDRPKKKLKPRREGD